MHYNPFARGPHPVGVRTIELTDAVRQRTLPTEVWYPAAPTYAGQDLDPERQDTFTLLPRTADVTQAAVRDATPAEVAKAPLIFFSHGLGGHRRQSTFFTTHLASHGYVVIAVDHVGNTLPDVVALAGAGRDAVQAALIQSARDRVRDVPFALQAFREYDPAFAAMTDGKNCGLTGHSFGGWTTVTVTSAPSPVRCALPLAPSGTGTAGTFLDREPYAETDLGYHDRVPTLILAAERDAICPLPGIERLYEALAPGHGMFVLGDADHFHFCDRALRIHEWYSAILEAGGTTGLAFIKLAPVHELVEEEPAHDFVRGPGLAHFDAHLRGRDDARAFLANGAAEALGGRGARVTPR